MEGILKSNFYYNTCLELAHAKPQCSGILPERMAIIITGWTERSDEQAYL